MKLFEHRGPATLESVSQLRRSLRREFAQLRIGAEMVDEVTLAVAELAANAVRHAPVAPRELAVSADLEGIVLRIVIEDDGAPFHGFAERWARASLAGAQDGFSGRGLALARSALDKVQYLPGRPNRLIAQRQLARRRPQLLVVEDEELLLETYLDLLDPHYRVLPAATLRDALALARETRVDLILTDFHLGSEPGTALIRALEDDSDRPPIPIVMITGDPSVRLRALELGVDTFLIKPVAPAALLETVKLTLLRATRQRTRMFRYFGAALEALVEPALPERMGGYSAVVRTQSADLGGGDLLVHLPRPDGDRIVLVDVMGHGIGAKAGAIAHAAMVRALDVGERLPPDQFLARWSNLIYSEPAFDAAIATALVVDLKAGGALEVVSAGHPHPMIIGASGARMIPAEGPLLGFREDAGFPLMRETLQPGERLLLVTDGLDPNELASGGPCPPWLLTELVARAASPLESAAARAETRISAHLGLDAEDDWVMVLIERTPADLPEAGPPAGAGDADVAELAVSAGAAVADPVEAPPPRSAGSASEVSPAPDPAAAGGVQLDLAGVAALRAAVGEDSFRRLAGRFVEAVPGRLRDWEALRAAGDGAGLAAPAHALAGLLGQFGLRGASGLARRVEETADATERLVLAEGLAPLADAELKAFEAWLNAPQSPAN